MEVDSGNHHLHATYSWNEFRLRKGESLEFLLLKSEINSGYSDLKQIQAVLTASEISTQSTASNLAEEVLGGIRTVLSFCGQNVESKRYDRLLRPAEEAGKRAGIASGVTDGLNELFLYVSQGLGFWYGAQLVLNDRDLNDKTYTPAVISIVSIQRHLIMNG